MFLVAVVAGDRSENVAIVRCSDEELKHLAWEKGGLTGDEYVLVVRSVSVDLTSQDETD